MYVGYLFETYISYTCLQSCMWHTCLVVRVSVAHGYTLELYPVCNRTDTIRIQCGHNPDTIGGYDVPIQGNGALDTTHQIGAYK